MANRVDAQQVHPLPTGATERTPTVVRQIAPSPPRMDVPPTKDAGNHAEYERVA